MITRYLHRRYQNHFRFLTKKRFNMGNSVVKKYVRNTGRVDSVLDIQEQHKIQPSREVPFLPMVTTEQESTFSNSAPKPSHPLKLLLPILWVLGPV